MDLHKGSLPRGRRLPEELPDVPLSFDLTHVERVAQRSLEALVAGAGGRHDGAATKMIPLGDIDVLADLLDEWGRRFASDRPDGVYFSGQPGLWHAFDQIYPLQDPNRWDRLRLEVVLELESRGWRRLNPPRGSSFILPS